MTTKALPAPLRNWFWLQALVLLLITLMAWPALADPPTRAARVLEVSGQAWWFDPEQRDWQPLLRNQSLAEGDRVRVDANGRVGLRIGASSLWLDERSQLELLRLDDERIDLALDRGALALRWATAEAAREAVVRTQEGRFLFEREGAFRIDQLPAASRAQAFEGRMRFEGRANADAPVWIDAPEQAELWWDGGPRAERSRAARQDSFGQWLVAELGFGRGGERYAQRDRPAYRYVSPDLTGADELDNHGRWEESSDYGALWVPLRVAVDWAPYRMGRWTWTRHWGWTWVDDMPWGYATSHYGRWVHWRGRWCWTPGARVVRPVFAPALVAWVGGSHVSVGIHIGGRRAPPVAWVPLAPREAFVPWYAHSPHYVRRFNPDPVTVRRPHEGPEAPYVHRNRQVPGAVSTLVTADRPVRGQDTRPVALRDEQVLRELAPLQYGPAAHQGPLPLRAAESAQDVQSRRGGGVGGRVREEERREPGVGMPLRSDPVRPQPRDEARQEFRQEQRLDTHPEPRREINPPTWQGQPTAPIQQTPMPERDAAMSRRDRAEREAQEPRRSPDRWDGPQQQRVQPMPQRVEPPRSEPRRPEVSAPARVEPPRRVEPPPEPRRQAPERKERDKEDGPRRDNR